MKRIVSLTVILCFALLALTLTATAQGPGLINYQGYLTDDQGDPVSGDYTMTFKIHDDPTGPNVIWEEPSQVVTVTEGLFEVILGQGISITDEVFSGDERWLQITVEGEDITPRTRLVSAPYAFRTATVDGATGGTISGDGKFTGGDVSVWSGNTALTLRNDGANTYLANKADFAGNGADPGGELNLIGSDGVQLFYGDDGAVGTLGLKVQSDGNVGIGTGAPNDNLTVQGTGVYVGTRAPFPSIVSGTNNGGAIYLGVGTTGSDVPTGAIETSWGDATNPQIGIGVIRGSLKANILMDHASQTWFRRGTTTDMFISAGGGVGIGTTDPDAKLDVVGGARFGTTNRVTITTSGDVGIGSTIPSATLDVHGDVEIFNGGLEVIGSGLMSVSNLEVTDITLGRSTQYGSIMLDSPFAEFWLGANGYSGYISLQDGAGNAPIVLNADNGKVVTEVLEITGGSDLAESFAMSDGNTIPQGALVVIDDKNPGHLKLSQHAYDTRVAGVVSGAGGVNPGLTLSQHDLLEGDHHVALTGQVYALADASFGIIRPGDLLTTSDNPGHAMKAADRERAYGAVIGKAMTGLQEGQGLVLVLVNLQ